MRTLRKLFDDESVMLPHVAHDIACAVKYDRRITDTATVKREYKCTCGASLLQREIDAAIFIYKSGPTFSTRIGVIADVLRHDITGYDVIDTALAIDAALFPEERTEKGINYDAEIYEIGKNITNKKGAFETSNDWPPIYRHIKRLAMVLFRFLFVR